MHKKIAFSLSIMILLFSVVIQAQESGSAFNFLNVTPSAHNAALGGQNISAIEDDASMIFGNPTSLANITSRTVNLNYMNYLRGCNSGSAAYVQAQGERGSWGIGAQFVGYGSIRETDAEGHILGTMSALDLNLMGGYSYILTEKLVGAVTGKFLYSHYGSYSSVGLCVDLGINYYNEEKDFSVSAVAANLGAQLKPFGDVRERLPFDLKIGFSKGIANLPARITVTMSDLTHWSSDDFFNNSGEKIGGFTMLMNHFSIGVDIFPTKNMWLALGYNFRKAYEMKAGGGSHAAGLSLGAGIDIKRFKIGFAWSKQHVSTNCLTLNLAYNFNK